MIISKVRFKNIFSYGNVFTEVDISTYGKTVIAGANGGGKSTIPNVIVFAIFGKTIKSVTKSQIINSLNNKQCLVEIEFSESGKQYLIRRGIKPNIFEIYEDGVLLDQSAVLDYQKHLEENIIKCSYRTFVQTCIISVESYVPFMALAKGARRQFVEDVLDINVFTAMNQLVKAKSSQNKEERRLTEVSLNSLKSRIMIQKGHIEQLQNIQQKSTDTILLKIKETTDQKTKAQEHLELLLPIVKEIELEEARLKALVQEHNRLTEKLNELKSNLRRVNTDKNFFLENSSCPTCRQELCDTHSKDTIDTANALGIKITQEMKTIQDAISALGDVSGSVLAVQQRAINNNSDMRNIRSNIIQFDSTIRSLELELSSVGESVNTQEQKDSLRVLAKEALVLKDKLTALGEETTYTDIMLELFKDSGIKSKIVDRYVPMINSSINTYLDAMNLFVLFTLDSEFSETIKSRHRDDFTYSSFSMGERARIDIAILFTFRQLARMRNSFSCNLLCMDEIFDASLDSSNVDLLMDLLELPEFDTTNIFVISHSNKNRFEDRFDRCINVKKINNFSHIDESVL